MSDNLWQRLVRGTRRFWQRADWEQFAGRDWAERIMDLAVTDQFHAKQGRSTGRWVMQARDRRLAVYLKRHYRLPRWLGLLAAIWPEGSWSPAVQEWQHLAWARNQGFPVPPGVAAGQYIGPWGRLQSFLAVEELYGMLPLHEAIPLARTRLDDRQFDIWKRTLIVELARLTRALHDRRRFHKDLYLCHFFIADADTAGVPGWKDRVHLIDLHRLSRHRLGWRIWQVKDLAQLLYSSALDEIDDRDRLAYWRAYQQGDVRRENWVRRLVLGKWRLYRRHNEKKKRRQALPGGTEAIVLSENGTDSRRSMAHLGCNETAATDGEGRT
jgi:heptose I phosphotransferase